MQATRNKPRCKESCPQHIFQLKNNNGNTKMDTKINFCPKFRRDPHPPQKTIPQYNLDNKFFTHAFVLGTEKKNLANNSHHQQVHFQTMIKDACQKNNQIFFPRPKQNNSYCSVCKEHFKNYYEHIRIQSHRIKIDAAIYNTEIKKLCEFYKVKWNGAHEKADQILNELFKNAQLYQKGIKQSNDDEDQNQESEQMINQQQQQEEIEQKQQEQEAQQGEEGQQEQEAAQVQAQEQEKEQAQGQQDQNQQQNSEESEYKEQIQESQKQLESQNQNQNKNNNQNKEQDENQMEDQNLNRKIDNKRQMQQMPFKIKKGQKKQNIFEQNLISQSSNSKSKTKNQQLSGFKNQFFCHKNPELVVFLHKNTHGKYQICQDIDKLKNNVTQSLEQGRANEKNSQLNKPIEQRYNLRGQRERYNYKQERYNLRQQRERKKTKDIQYTVPRYAKEPKQIYKIKCPQKEKEAESENSSFKFNEDQKLCQALKQRITRDRVKTRNERREQKNTSGQQNDKQKEKKKDKEKSKDKDKQKEKQKSKQKQKQKSKQKQKQKDKDIEKEINESKKINNQQIQVQDAIRQKMINEANQKKGTNIPNTFHMGINPNQNPGSNPSSGPINYPIYGHPSPMNPNRMGMPKMSPYPMYLPHPPPPGQPNSKMTNPPRMSSGGYIPPPMIMNPQYFNSGPMPYNIPNSDDKSKEGRPQYPMYYPPPWNGYMMPPPSMMPASEGNSEQTSMPRPTVPPPYRMMPHPPQSNGPKTISTGSNVNQMPNMGSNMVYMQYPMGPRYPYMGYPYMPKQGQQPPRDPRGN